MPIIAGKLYRKNRKGKVADDVIEDAFKNPELYSPGAKFKQDVGETIKPKQNVFGLGKAIQTLRRGKKKTKRLGNM